MKNIQVDEANLSTWQGLIVPDNSSYDKGAFRIDINFPADYPLNHPRSHLKQRSTTLTSMRRGGSVCAIFQVLQCAFLIFHVFLVISSFFKSSSGCFSNSIFFSFLAIFPVLQWTFLNFPPFSVFLAIFHVLKCVFLIFRDFQFSRHIPGPSM